MWYVNILSSLHLGHSSSSFILTMWYVNMLIVILSFCLFNLFYINYVVCKFIFNASIIVRQVKFYINYVVCKFLQV